MLDKQTAMYGVCKTSMHLNNKPLMEIYYPNVEESLLGNNIDDLTTCEGSSEIDYSIHISEIKIAMEG